MLKNKNLLYIYVPQAPIEMENVYKCKQVYIKVVIGTVFTFIYVYIYLYMFFYKKLDLFTFIYFFLHFE